MKNRKIITVFGSSKPKEGEKEYSDAFEIGSLIARAGYALCNGGYSGTMEASAKGARENSARTIGVTLNEYRAQPNRYIDEEIKTDSLYKRLDKLVSLADAYVALKGGSGTLLELSLVVELILKGMIRRRPVILMSDYFKPVIDLLEDEAKSNPNSYPKQSLGSLSGFVKFCVSPDQAITHIKERLS